LNGLEPGGFGRYKIDYTRLLPLRPPPRQNKLANSVKSVAYGRRALGPALTGTITDTLDLRLGRYHPTNLQGRAEA
jgi:hypothetical protein